MAHKSNITQVTKYNQVLASAEYEAWCDFMAETTSKQQYSYPYRSDCFNIENMVRFTCQKADAMIPRIDKRPQVISFISKRTALLGMARMNGFETPKGFIKTYIEKLMVLATLGVLSNTGKKKIVVDGSDLVFALKKTFENPVRDLAYTIQVTALSLVLFYTGLRIGSLVPTYRHMANDWKYLRWRDVLIYRTGRDSNGDILHAKLTIRHMKNKSFVVQQSEHIESRTIRSPTWEASHMDMALLLGVLATLRGVAETPVLEWYKSGKVYFGIKSECLDNPVFCNSVLVGSAHHLTNDVWVGDQANKAYTKLMRKGDIKTPGSTYSLRRNFAETAARHVTKEMTNLATGHKAQSDIVYSHYIKSFEHMDVVALVTEDHLNLKMDTEHYVDGNWSLANYQEKRLDASEFKEHVTDLMVEIDSKQKDLKKMLIDKYHALNASTWGLLTEQEQHDYKKATRDRKKKMAMLVSKAQNQKLINIHHNRVKNLVAPDIESDDEQEELEIELLGVGESLESAVVESSGTEIAESAATTAVATTAAATTAVATTAAATTAAATTTDRSSDERYRITWKYLHTPTTVTGFNSCPWCNDEDGSPRLYEGHTEYVQHLCKNFYSASWADTGPSLGTFVGTHTNTHRFRQQYLQNNPTSLVCQVPDCFYEFQKIPSIRTLRTHLNVRHQQHDLSRDEAFELVRQHLLSHCQVRFERSNFDQALLPRSKRQ